VRTDSESIAADLGEIAERGEAAERVRLRVPVDLRVLLVDEEHTIPLGEV
jgi:hypothetical protein